LHVSGLFDLTAEKLIEYQKNDIDLNFLISWKEKGEKPVWETVSPCSPAVKYHWSRWATSCLCLNQENLSLTLERVF
jgi:hypothetical protein